MRWLRERMSSPNWPRWRAGLIALVVLVHSCAALPMPRPIRAEDARTPTAQEEIDRWRGILSSLGYDASEEELLELVNGIGSACAEVKSTVMAPFRPVLRFTGTGQAWALFAYPDRFPNRLNVEIRGPEDEWRTVYAAADAEHTFMAAHFAYRRVRGVYDTAAAKGAPGRVYDRFADWVARETLAAYPEATTVRVKMLQRRVSLPGEDPEADQEKARLVRLRTREQVEGGL